MNKFKDIDEVEEWLKPMDYGGFWYAIEPHNLVLQSRDHCDQQIRDGEVKEELVLSVLKGMARMELTKRHELHWRMPTPWIKVVK